MFVHGGDAAEAAFTGRERHFRIRLQVDWNKNGKYDHGLSDLSRYISQATTDRSLRGSAPEEILLIEGASAAELSFTANGDYRSVPFEAVFSPYNGMSPFYNRDPIGAEVRYWLGIDTTVGTVWYPQFVGNIRTITPSRANATVQFTALDRVEQLRRPIQLPPWAMSDEQVAYGETDAQLIRSHWVIDHCLRLCDTSPSAYRPNYREETGLSPDSVEGPQFFLSGNGSYLPTMGWMDNLDASSFPNDAETPMFWQTGPLHPSAPPGTPRPLALAGMGTIGQTHGSPAGKGVLRYWAADRDGMFHGSTHYAGFTINNNGPAAGQYRFIASHNALEVRVGESWELRVVVDTGRVSAHIVNTANGQLFLSSAWVPIPDLPNIDVAVQWDNSGTTGGRIHVRAGTNDNGGLIQYGGPTSGGVGDNLTGRVTIGHALSLSDVYFANRHYFGAGIDPTEARRPARYTAVLDQGLNRYSHVPSHQLRDAWDIITDVASAEFGSVLWDEEGVFRFWTYQTIQAKQATIESVLTLDQVTNLEITNTLDSVRNIYSVQARRKRAMMSGAAAYASSDPNQFYVPAGTEKRFRLWIEDIVSPLPASVQKHTTLSGTGFPAWGDSIGHGYCVQHLINGTWQERGDRVGIDVNVYINALGYLTVRIWNGWGEPIRLATNTGQAAFRFRGTKIQDFATVPVLTRDQRSINIYGPRHLQLSSDWHQDSFAANKMLDVLLPRTAKPIPTTDSITIAGDPRLQLGDCIQIRDENGLAEFVNLQIYGIRRAFNRDSGLTDTLTVEMLRPPGKGLWDSRQYARWDTTFTWS